MYHSYGPFPPHSMKKKENQWRVSGGFPFQYFVSCGVFISWVVTNKAHLIEISIYFLKVLVRKKRLHFLLEISQPHIRCSLLQPAAWNEIWLNVFNALSVIKLFRDFISVAVSEGAVSLSLSVSVVEWFKVVEQTCWLTGWDSISLGQTSGAYIS